MADGLYEKIISLENLLLAYKKARKGKTKKWYVQEFESRLDQELLSLFNELKSRTYNPRPMKRFVIRDPKTRVIHASHFRDRVVHHAIINILEPIFEKVFICDSYASRKNKGPLAAIDRFDRFQRKVTQSGRLIYRTHTHTRIDNNLVVGYMLKCDIRRYFQSIDHEILISVIRRKIADESAIDLIRTILDENSKSLKQEKGMPIGNLTSQFFANVYMNELDYFVKHRLKAKYYIRYVDDFVILHEKKETLLTFKEKIGEFLKSLKIELHKDKSQVYPLHKGTQFLGFRIFYHYRLPSKRNIRSIRRKIGEMSELYEQGIVSKGKIDESIEGWCAYAKWGNTYNLRKRLAERLSI